MNESIINRIRDIYGRPDFTNCILPLEEIENGLNGARYVIISEEPLLLIEQHNDYNRLYYFFNKERELQLQNSKKILLGHMPLYADITLKGDFVFNNSVFDLLGFSPYRVYERKYVINDNLKIRKMMGTKYACVEETKDILRILNDQFDVMADCIPSENELYNMLERRQVLKIDINGDLAGVLLFEDTGKKSYARSLCVEPRFQNSFVGYSLFADYFLRHDANSTRMFTLWVDEANTYVEKFHDRFGYKPDGLKNYVFRIADTI